MNLAKYLIIKSGDFVRVKKGYNSKNGHKLKDIYTGIYQVAYLEKYPCKNISKAVFAVFIKKYEPDIEYSWLYGKTNGAFLYVLEKVMSGQKQKRKYKLGMIYKNIRRQLSNNKKIVQKVIGHLYDYLKKLPC